MAHKIASPAGIPVTELPNELTSDLDVQSPLGIVRLLRSTDAQIFSGWGGLPSLYDKIPEIEKVGTMAAELLREHESSVIVLSGSGTSGRIAFLAAEGFNLALRQAGLTPCFRYLISGGDPALLLSDELPEDDTELAVRELNEMARGKRRALVVGITCGLSAPYAGAMVDYAMDCAEAETETEGDATKYYGVAMGFNPAELARAAPIEMWRDRRSGCKSFLDIATRLQRVSAGDDAVARRFCLLNPVVGPEPVTASSRMKGGSVTKILLETAFSRALHEVAKVPLLVTPLASAANADDGDTPPASKRARLARPSTEQLLEAFESAVRSSYLPADAIAQLVEAAGLALRGGGHLYYLAGAEGNAGYLGCMDASEMPDTYGCPFDEVRAFVEGSWPSVGNADGDLSGRGSLFRIGLNHFGDDIVPKLGSNDLVCVLAEGLVSDAVRDMAIAAHDAGAKVVAAFWHSAGTTDIAEACPQLASVCTATVNVALSRSELIPGYRAFTEISIKLVANAITTGAQVMKGFVFGNRMVNTGPTNNKIYHRCVELISLLTEVDVQAAETFLLRAIYRVDVLPDGVMEKPTSVHIKAGTPTGDALHEQQQTLPLAILLAAQPSFTVKEALEALAADPVVRNVIAKHRSK